MHNEPFHGTSSIWNVARSGTTKSTVGGARGYMVKAILRSNLWNPILPLLTLVTLQITVLALGTCRPHP